MSSMHLNGKKMLKRHLKGNKSYRKWAVALNRNDSEKKNGTQGLICPHPWTFSMFNTIIFKHLLL